MVDSIKASYGQVVLVDDGGYFPEQDNYQDVAGFLMDAMMLLGTDAVGVGDRDLRYGLAYFKSQVKRTRLPMVCANLLEKRTRGTVVPPYLIKKVGTAKVGIFGLISDKASLGPAKDSLIVAEPNAVAKKMVADLRAKGATVIVLLSQLGKVESEDLVSSVDGINAVVAGRDVPMIQKGRMIKSTVAGYGGDQGQYVVRTELALDAKRKVTTGDAEAIMLGPEIAEEPEIQKLVKSFEDGFNEKQRKEEAKRLAEQQKEKAAAENPEHFLGAEVCIRCHAAEGEQWKTTSHSLAWQTLVNAKKEATPECVPCHVVGYKQAGGFQSGSTTPQLGNVQCENCHGLGTQHEAFATAPHQVTEQVCITCHHGENDPEFNWEKKMPMIAHGNTSGETIKSMKNKPSGSMMGGHGGSR